MFDFFKKLIGLPTQDEINAAKAKSETVPYKLETPVVNNKTGDVVEPAVVHVVKEQVEKESAPAKKTRKPRAKKSDVEVKEKAVKSKKVAAKKTAKKTKLA